MAESSGEVLVRVRLGKQDAEILKRFEKVAAIITEIVEDLPWKQDEVRKLKMHLRYIAKHLKIEKVE